MKRAFARWAMAIVVIGGVCGATSLTRADDSAERQETLDALRRSVRYAKPADKTRPDLKAAGVSHALGSLAARLATPAPAPLWDGVQPASHQAPVVISDDSPIVPAVATVETDAAKNPSAQDAPQSCLRINPLRTPIDEPGPLNKSAETSNPLRAN
ncbi:MAG: hypothetical protein JSS27_17235 [Planctomycetes bacterium]|nr:hypothetical protein [Planctomycetota bacterium]